MAKAEGLLPKFLHFQTHVKYTEDKNIEVQLEDVTGNDFVDVVRCKDCFAYKKSIEFAKAANLNPDEFCGLLLVEMPPDGFCYYGKWRTEDE